MVPPDELEQYPRPKLRRFFLLPAAIIIAVAALVAGLRPADDGDADRGPQPAPAFDLALLDGGTLASAELEGEPIILNLWASWCGPCREEAPTLERLWRRHRHHGLQIIGVNTRDSDEEARRFVEEYDITYPIVRDPQQELVKELEDVSGLRGALPQTFFIGRDGNFLAVESGDAISSEDSTTVLGAISEEDLEAQIQELLQTRATATP